MGFTIEDMLVVSQDRYKMKMIAGNGGWSNSISWLLMVEDMVILQNFGGKELAVTTGLGFPSEESLLALVQGLSARSASGLVINTGHYVHEIPASVREFCDANDLPLLTIPWEIYLADMIKDISIRIFLQTSADEQISEALIHAIEQPEAMELYTRELLPFFDLDGSFQAALVTTGNLAQMDTVERKRISYRMQLYLTNLTHNGHFFYYASYFVIIMNAMTAAECEVILGDFAERVRRKMPDLHVCIGVSDPVMKIENLHIAYKRARAAVQNALRQALAIQYFDRMGLYRMLYLIEDHALLYDLSDVPLAPVLEYDREHDAGYLETLESYLQNGGSIKAMSEELYVHRNTIMCRMANIKKLLGSDLTSPQDRFKYMVACMIRRM